MASKRKIANKKKGINTLPLYVALLILFVLFIYYQGNGLIAVIVGIALFMVIVILIVLEVMNGIKEEGLKRNVIEIGVAILIVVVFWFSLKAVLHTNYPLDVVPSCSMLPQLKRGDLILLQGVNESKGLKAPVISVSSAAYGRFLKNIQNESLSCVAYKYGNNKIEISQIVMPGDSVGLFDPLNGGRIVPSNFQQGDLVQYTCGSANLLFSNGTMEKEAYTAAVTINGTALYGDANNSVIVYETVPQDYFYQLGDGYVVHRVYAILNVSGKYFVLTKGDNNPGLDLQYGNYPVNSTYVEGKVLYSAPYLGYLKLALSNSFVEPAGCNSTIVS